MKNKFLPFYALLIIVLAIYGFKTIIIDSGIPFWVKPDIKETHHIIGRKVTGYSNSLKLGNTKFIAQIATGYHENTSYSDKDFLTISVLSPKKKNRWSVYYERQISLKAVPNNLQWKSPLESHNFNISNQIQYEDRTRTVVFVIGDNSYKYKLPYF